MAAAWDATAIDRCIIQAHYAQAGCVQEDEMAWLLIPADWPQDEVQQLSALYPDGTPRPIADGTGATTGKITAAPANAYDLDGAESPRNAHTPTELYTDAEESEGIPYSKEGDGDIGTTSLDMAEQGGEIIFVGQEEPLGVRPDSTGAHADLLDRFLARYVENRRLSSTFGNVMSHC